MKQARKLTIARCRSITTNSEISTQLVIAEAKLSKYRDALEMIATYNTDDRPGVDMLWLMKKNVRAMVAWAKTALPNA